MALSRKPGKVGFVLLTLVCMYVNVCVYAGTDEHLTQVRPKSFMDSFIETSTDACITRLPNWVLETAAKKRKRSK